MVTHHWRQRALGAVAVTLAVIGVFGGGAAYSVATVASAHLGGNPSVGPARAGGTPGGMDGRENSDQKLVRLLTGSTARWSAAVTGSSAAASLELATRTSVMAIGGFTGQDPAPSLAEFESYVANHQIDYYIVLSNGNRGYSPAPHAVGNAVTAQVTTWIIAKFPATTVGNATVYDLRADPQD